MPRTKGSKNRVKTDLEYRVPDPPVLRGISPRGH